MDDWLKPPSNPVPVVRFSPRASLPLSRWTMPLVSREVSALLSVVRSRMPHPSSSTRPARVVMPRRNWVCNAARLVGAATYVRLELIVTIRLRWFSGLPDGGEP